MRQSSLFTKTAKTTPTNVVSVQMSLLRYYYFIFIGTIFFLTPIFSYAQTALPATVGERDTRLNELRRSIQELKDAPPRTESSSAQNSVILQDDYAARFEKAKANFKVTAPTTAITDRVCEAAAIQWMQSKYCGVTLHTPIPIRCKVGKLGAGGATTFSFAGAEAFGWDMTVQGDLDTICNSVIPHEMFHVFNALDLRRPLWRWADEGIASLNEIESERRRQWALFKQVFGTQRFIPIGELLRITDYSKDMSRVLVVYAEGTVLSDFLVSRAAKASGQQWTQEQARQWMADFLKVVFEKNQWDAALYDYSKQLGGISNVAQLSSEFNKWIKSGQAKMYEFQDADPIVQSDILQVKYRDIGNKNKRIIPAN